MKYPRSSKSHSRYYLRIQIDRQDTYGSEANWSVNVMDREGVVVGCGEVMSSLDV